MDWIEWLLELLRGRDPLIIERTVKVYTDTSNGWDNLRNWLTFGAAVIAGLAAAIGSGVALATWKRSEQERIEEREEKRRAQAARVVGTVSMVTDEHGRIRPVGEIHNSSDLPVYNVLAMVSDAKGVATNNPSTTRFRTIPPHTTRETPHTTFYPAATAKNHEDDLRVSVWFKDAGGVEWLRNDSGELIEAVVNAGTGTGSAKGLSGQQASDLLRVMSGMVPVQQWGAQPSKPLWRRIRWKFWEGS